MVNLKPAWKSIEGQGSSGVIGVLLYFLNDVLSGEKFSKNIVELLQSQAGTMDFDKIFLIQEISTIVKTGLILTAVCFVLFKLVEHRSYLKNDAIKAAENIEIAKINTPGSSG